MEEEEVKKESVSYKLSIVDNRLVMKFSSPVKWIGFNKKEVARFLKYLSETLYDENNEHKLT